jgi:hypothetical protein
LDQLRKFDRLTKNLYSAYAKAQKEALLDPDDNTTLTLGQAFKNSIDLRKHGGKVGLPADLWGRIREKALQNSFNASVGGAIRKQGTSFDEPLGGAIRKQGTYFDEPLSTESWRRYIVSQQDARRT